jgi:subtilisin family serine protease
MSDLREYAVSVHRGVDLSEFETKMRRKSGSYGVPKRNVEIANPRPISKRITHYYLTEEEAQKLREHPDVYSVDIPIYQDDTVQSYKANVQTGNFARNPFSTGPYKNWGLLQVNANTIDEGFNLDASSPDYLNSTGEYRYILEGEGVDVVIVDTGIDPDHPEFQDENGNSRVQLMNWYTASGRQDEFNSNFFYRDLDGHGTAVAGVVAGNTFGWAKKAKIYAMKLNSLVEDTLDELRGINEAEAHDIIKDWHQLKPVGANGYKRPTVVVMAYSTGYPVTSSNLSNSSGVYRPGGVDEQQWSFGVDYLNAQSLYAGVGIPDPGDGYVFLPATNGAVNTDIQEMIDAGIHVIISAGNSGVKMDVQGGLDYNNTITTYTLKAPTEFTTIPYHRPPSPYDDEAILVGAISSQSFAKTAQEVVVSQLIASYSNRGPAVDMFAPGSQIVTAWINEQGSAPYNEDSAYSQLSLSGTSFSAPQVGGVAALHLQALPGLTPAQLKSRLVGDCKSFIYDVAPADDNRDYANSIDPLGAPTRTLFNRYNVSSDCNLTNGIQLSNLSSALA